MNLLSMAHPFSHLKRHSTFDKFEAAADLATKHLRPHHPGARIYYGGLICASLVRFGLEMRDGSLFTVQLWARDAVGLNKEEIAGRICEKAEALMLRTAHSR